MLVIGTDVGGGSKGKTTTTTTKKTTTPAKTTTVNSGAGASAAKKTTTSTYKAPTTAAANPSIVPTKNTGLSLLQSPLYTTMNNINKANTILNPNSYVYSNEAKQAAQNVINNKGLSTGGYGFTKNAIDLSAALPTATKASGNSGGSSGGSTGGSARQTIETLSTNGYYDQLLDYFKDKNEEARNSAIAAIMQRLNTLKGMYGTQMEDLDEEYQKLINQNEVQRYKSKGAIREALANRGQLDSGLGRQEQLYLDTKYGNQTSNLKAQKQKAKQDIQNLINQAIAEAEADKAETNNAYNNALLQYELANA